MTQRLRNPKSPAVAERSAKLRERPVILDVRQPDRDVLGARARTHDFSTTFPSGPPPRTSLRARAFGLRENRR